jgi:hypothetical protein
MPFRKVVVSDWPQAGSRSSRKHFKQSFGSVTFAIKYFWVVILTFGQ